ncbi:MAG: hypothetical protein FJY85_04740 [Deltaproteobacteria bacterium]|nr:hypothetical protein [Deltaproteobacteria bacterium]
MDRRIGVYGVVAGLLILLCVANDQVLAQRFPYEAPRAPEFDRNGNHIPSQRQESAPTMGPIAPSRVAPMAPEFRQREPVSSYRVAPSQETATMASSPPPEPVPVPQQPQPQEPPDCSQFPMMISTAQTREAMQWNAKLYLTCLLQRGWRMEQARQEVIRVIETAHGKPQ